VEFVPLTVLLDCIKLTLINAKNVIHHAKLVKLFPKIVPLVLQDSLIKEDVFHHAHSVLLDLKECANNVIQNVMAVLSTVLLALIVLLDSLNADHHAARLAHQTNL
jgi:hypothetical protein